MSSGRFSIRTLRQLITLRDGGEVTAGEVQSREMRGLMEYLARQGAVSVMRQRSRIRYSAPDKERFLRILAGYHQSLVDLDASLRQAEGEVFSREDKVRIWGDSKEGGTEASESGFSIIPTRPVEVFNHGRAYLLTPDTALLVCDDGQALRLPEKWTVFVVENSRLFFRHDWLQRIGLDNEITEKCFIVKMYPETAEQKEFLKNTPLKVLYFGDLDLGGVRIYETKFRKKVGEKMPFIVPPDAEARISGPKGNRKLYKNQMDNGLADVEASTEELSELVRIIHKHQSVYEQEGYCCDD